MVTDGTQPARVSSRCLVLIIIATQFGFCAGEFPRRAGKFPRGHLGKGGGRPLAHAVHDDAPGADKVSVTEPGLQSEQLAA